MNKHLIVHILLALFTLGVGAYTIIAFQNEGIELFQQFKSNVFAFGWNGQFNLDFLCYLILSGLWVMWRSNYTTTSILVGLLAMIIGIIFFAPYIIYLLIKEKGILNKVLLGVHY